MAISKRAALAIMEKVDAFGEAKAVQGWMDDQGTGKAVDTARQDSEEARREVLHALGLKRS